MGDSGRRSSWLLYKRRRRFRRLEAIPLQYSREKSSIVAGWLGRAGSGGAGREGGVGLWSAGSEGIPGRAGSA